ncbi:hypothetical protein C0992_011927 [Termitomyces sp. T32_za158]|nr:hypothetical protein C0992_011927 [Termitomyces sp. T32_za158]
MNDRRNSDPNLDSNSVVENSRRASGSFQSSSTGGGYPILRSRSNSGRPSTYEDTVKSLKHQLSVANSKLKGHELLAAETEEQILALTNHLRFVNDARAAALHDAAKANEELRLYKIRLQSANQEIQRAQAIIDRVERERYDAEKAAAEARSMARRYQRDLLVIKAMEEGRKLGVQEGFEQGRELAFSETDTYEDMHERGYANEYLNPAETESQSRSVLLGSNEEIVVLPPDPAHIDPVPQPPPKPIPVPPPEPIQPIPTTRPLSIRSPSPSVMYPSVSIPPDGYIPTLDSDNYIRIPPPHELAKPPPTPEQPASPQLPDVSQEEPRPSSQTRRRRQSNSSLASASTAVGPLGRAPPLSAIPEARSTYTSPAARDADGQTLRHQPSQISSRYLNVNPEGGAGPQPAQSPSINRRQSVSSNVSGVLRPSNTNQEDRRKSTASSSSLGINIVPPPNQSRPRSSGTLRSQHNVLNNPPQGEGTTNVSGPPSMMSQLFGDRIIGQPDPSTSGPAADSYLAPIPGGYPDRTDQTSTREHLHPGSSSRLRLVDDDNASVRSRDTLTTPRARRRSRNQSRTSLDALPVENHGTTGWEDAVRLAGSHVPVPHDNRTSRPLSSSNR